MSKEFNPLSEAVAAALPEPAEPAPALTIQHALIMLTYAVEQNFGELTIPYQYVEDKVLGKNPAELTVTQNEDGSVTMKVKSNDTRTRIIL